MQFRGRRPRTRRFTRSAPPAAPPAGNAPLDDPILHSPPQDDILPVPEAPRTPSSGRALDSTAGATDTGAGIEPQAETSGALAIIPEPPARVEFACPCGIVLVATHESYDRRSRCPSCKTVLLLNLVYKRDLRAFEIEPFTIEPESLA